ncbi:DUF1566 domain-containing protein [Methylomonas sp. MO1]|uniref:Lcl C-terminal domain-containing protein n=1 Tax=Methylomonas sp. MO1 TaxID=3073619 RepID=UPI0028A401D8|nr:DUF1566 domain-containing protein [Methylomonas sp. MO1]MDT4288434.1 DUF1566 domain-containing protein [Methylomonas sp. MO1]
MKLKPSMLAAGLLLSLTTLTAEASLTSYTGAGGAGLVYSSVSNVTWTQDANLFKTLYDANNNLVNLITAVTPSYTDPANGIQAIGDGGAIDDFDTASGRLSWWGAKAFVNYLNSINYAGSIQWRLPTSNAIVGYNGTAGNELGQLFYSELGGGTAGNTIPNTANFTNEQAYVYWYGTEYAPNPTSAWLFNTIIGLQAYSDKTIQLYAWAVSPGQVAAAPVPAPGAIWLMGTGLLGLLGVKRREHAG